MTMIPSDDRNRKLNKGVFDLYIEEMFELETKGFVLHIDNKVYNIYVVFIQIIGDNIGLNNIRLCRNFYCNLSVQNMTNETRTL